MRVYVDKSIPFTVGKHKRLLRRQSSSSMSELEAELADIDVTGVNSNQSDEIQDMESKHPSRQYRLILKHYYF